MRTTVLFSLSVALLLGACSAGPREQAAVEAPVEAPAKAVDDGGLDLSGVASIRPRAHLSESMLFDLLVAEMAAQQGNMALAAVNYQRVALLSRDARLAQRATQLAVFARDFELAMQAAGLWIRLDPWSLEARQALSALLIGFGRGEESLPHLEVIIDRQTPEAGFEQVLKILARAEDAKMALSLIATLAEDYPGPLADMARARLAAQLGVLDVAEAQLQALLSADPENLAALLLLSRVQSDRDQGQAALDSLAKATELAPEDAEARRRYARMLIELKRLPEAREQFEALLRLQGETPEAEVIYALGLLAIEEELLDEAEAYLLRLTEDVTHADGSFFALARIADMREQWAQAIDWYSRVKGEHNRLKAQMRIVQVLREHQSDEAALDYLRAISAQNEIEEAQLALSEADLLEQMERADEAMERLNAALDSHPDNIDLLYARAMLGERLGYLNILERDLRAILAFDENSAEALNALGYTLADRTSRHQEALELIERALALKPEDPAVLDSMGWVLYRLGRLEEALEYIRRAAAKLDDGEISAHLGEILWMLGQHEEARQVWEAAHAYESGAEVLRETIERLQP